MVVDYSVVGGGGGALGRGDCALVNDWTQRPPNSGTLKRGTLESGTPLRGTAERGSQSAERTAGQQDAGRRKECGGTAAAGTH